MPSLEDGSTDRLIARILEAFAATPRPPDPFLVGSRDGCEPEDAVAPFHGRDWQSVTADVLDDNYTALGFFSEGGFRYFLPAFLIADVRGELQTADPCFHLTHGFSSTQTTIPAGGRMWTRRLGGDTLLNPRRYGAISWRDHARFRLAVFSREEAAAIVEYLRWRIECDPSAGAPIEHALEGFWVGRAACAPTTRELELHLEEEAAFAEALSGHRGGPA